MTTLTLRPISFRAACAFIKREHSHLSPPQGWLCGVAVYDGDRLCCVATMGRPSARKLDDGITCEITRVASDRTPHCASKAIAALTRAAFALGYTKVVSYTRADEEGTCYMAAGWTAVATSKGGEWTRPSRERKSAEQPCLKVRWERVA